MSVERQVTIPYLFFRHQKHSSYDVYLFAVWAFALPCWKGELFHSQKNRSSKSCQKIIKKIIKRKRNDNMQSTMKHRIRIFLEVGAKPLNSVRITGPSAEIWNLNTKYESAIHSTTTIGAQTFDKLYTKAQSSLTFLMLFSDLQSEPIHVEYSAGLTHGKPKCQKARNIQTTLHTKPYPWHKHSLGFYIKKPYVTRVGTSCNPDRKS